LRASSRQRAGAAMIVLCVVVAAAAAWFRPVLLLPGVHERPLVVWLHPHLYALRWLLSLAAAALCVGASIMLRRTASDAAAAPMPVARYFACVADVVQRHEAGHAAIARRTAEALHDDLLRGLKDVNCGALQTKGTLIHRRRLARGDDRQTAFDTTEYARPRYKKCRSYLK